MLDVIYKAKSEVKVDTGTPSDFDCNDTFIIAEVTDKDDLSFPSWVKAGEEGSSFTGCVAVHNSRKLPEVFNSLLGAGIFFFIAYLFLLSCLHYFRYFVEIVLFLSLNIACPLYVNIIIFRH